MDPVELMEKEGDGVMGACDSVAALLQASYEDDCEGLQQMLRDSSASRDARTENGETLLMLAVSKSHELMAQLLIDHGADVNASDHDSRTPLMLAAKRGHGQIVQLLMQHEVNVEAQSQSGKTALMYAALNGHTDIARLLLDRGASITAREKSGATSLLLTSWEGHEDTARLLIECGADVDAQDENGNTALIFASERGHNQVVHLLLECGASVAAETKTGETALVLAASTGDSQVVELLITHHPSLLHRGSSLRHAWIFAAFEGHDEVIQLLLQHGVSADLASEDDWTALMYAAENGQHLVCRLLLEYGASVDAVDKEKWTALMIAAYKGHLDTLDTLLQHNADLERVNDENYTALMLAAREGHVDAARVLIDSGASVSGKNKDGYSALMLAIEGGHEDIIRELLLVDDAMTGAMELFHLGLRQKTAFDRDSLQQSRIQAHEATITLDKVKTMCSLMHEAQPMCLHVHERLERLATQLQKTEMTSEALATSCRRILERFHAFLSKYSNKHTVTRLVSSHLVMQTCRDIHIQLDTLVKEHGLESAELPVLDWETQWEQDSNCQRAFFTLATEQKTVLAHELQDPAAQTEALTLLLFEYDQRKDRYFGEELVLIHSIFQSVAGLSRLEIPSVPLWFVPPHEVEFNTVSYLARGSYASVHSGTWNGVSVVVKSAFLQDENSREMFLNEAEIWFKFQHPHVVRLFGACHVGNPFFVCEYASHGTLTDFLYRNGNRRDLTWAKLHEAALGLHYLHTKQKVVHGDLKCNNLLVGEDCRAKLMDFGLSFLASDANLHAIDPGAVRWKAPEVLQRKTRGTFASDVYSFGMCIIEATASRVPWGIMPDVAVKHKVLIQKELPKQPSCMTAAQWKFVTRMCAWDAMDRPDMTQVVNALEEFANQEFSDKAEAEWREYKAAIA